MTGAGTGECSGEQWLHCVLTNGVAGAILERTDIASVYDQDTNSNPGELNFIGSIVGIGQYITDPLLTILKFIGLALVVTIAAVVLFAGAFMLISRAVVLAFLMVTSPIGFAGMAIPPLQGLAKMWWDKLIKQALFAPVFLILIFVALKMTDGLAQLTTANGSLASALSGSTTEGMGVLLLFGLVIGFFIGALLIANQFGIYGASVAVNGASGLVYGTLARSTNLLVGGAATRLQRVQMNRQNLLNTKGIRKFGAGPIGVAAVKYLIEPTAKANMDMRNMPLVGGVLKGALSAGGVSEGLKEAEHAKFDDLAHIYDDAKRGKFDRDLQTKYNRESNILKLETEGHNDNGSPATRMSDESVNTLNELSEGQLLQLHGIRSAVKSLAANLRPDKFESLMKNKDLDDTTKQELKDARKEYLTKDPNGVTTIKNMKPEVIVKLPNSILTSNQVMGAMTARQFGHLNTNNFNSTELQSLVDHMKRQQAAAPGTPQRDQWDNFERLAKASPAIKRKWAAAGVVFP
jgi:hypothetical protein